MSTQPTADSAAHAPADRINSLRERELAIAQEIAHAFLTASRPVEVYRLALARVTPLVHASFGSVFLRDQTDPSLLKLACAHNWPQTSARFLSQLRIRVGRGPTGRAVEERAPFEVEDIFSDPTQREWWEPARELGFTSLITLPLIVRGERAEGALSFYFDEPHPFDDEERRLLSLIADQLAATAEKAHMIENLQAANQRLTRQNRELTRRVREAEEAKQLKNEFLANVSHELRTPLTAILGYTYLLTDQMGTSLDGDQRSAVQKIDRSATVLLRLINDLLDLSHLKLGRMVLAPAPAEAAALARQAADGIDRVPDGIDFRIRSPDGPVVLETDAQKVLQILGNLLSNAFKFTTRGQVEVTVRTSGTQVEWEVRDTGIGIAADDLPSIFDEFRQVDGSSTRLYGGTGLGLALSLRLARLLGGELRAESTEGVGSTFTLILPRSLPAEAVGKDA